MKTSASAAPVALLLFTYSLMSLPAFGWGQTGHRITGAIAERHLSTEAKQQIEAILPVESLAEASTYPDDMRSNPSEFWQEKASPWHYVTVPEGKHYHDVGAPEQGDAFTALEKFTATLKDSDAALEDKQLALRFIVHIIGDLHQPLHAGNGTDRGGSSVKVRFFGQDSNLHRVWDSQMIAQQELSYTEWTNWLDKRITQADIEAWHDTDPQVWITESTEIRENIYPQDANRMGFGYMYTHLPTVKLRLEQAGIRIAHYLNAVFGQ